MNDREYYIWKARICQNIRIQFLVGLSYRLPKVELRSHVMLLKTCSSQKLLNSGIESQSLSKGLCAVGIVLKKICIRLWRTGLVEFCRQAAPKSRSIGKSSIGRQTTLLSI